MLLILATFWGAVGYELLWMVAHGMRGLGPMWMLFIRLLACTIKALSEQTVRMPGIPRSPSRVLTIPTIEMNIPSEHLQLRAKLCSPGAAFGAAEDNDVMKLHASGGPLETDVSDFCLLSGTLGAAQNNEIMKLRTSCAPLYQILRMPARSCDCLAEESCGPLRGPLPTPRGGLS